jgi:small basic protein (TIGR04137 family)
MSLDRSLKSANALIRHRNVLTRAERLEKLKEQEKWSEDKNGVFGLPKVAHRKAAVVKSVKEEAAAEGAAPAATTQAGVAPAAAGKAAPAAAAGAKGAAAPSAGGKATAPAAGKAAPAAKKK